jgi:4-phytase / acid phosphatase
MRIRVLVFVFVSALLAAAMPAAAQIPIPPGWQAERAVVLVRDGVHAPLTREVDMTVATPWPIWPVPPGALTPHGKELQRLMGGYYRALQGGRGLTQTDDCPPAGTVAAWADTDPPSRDTGAALMSGMYPGCNLAPRSQADTTRPDPLFHPQPTPSCPMDAASNRAALLARIGGNFDSVLREYAPQLSLMQATLCPPALTGGRTQCGLPAEAPAVRTGPDGRLTITGPIGIGSAAAKNFSMENAEGMPANQVAWGRLSGGAAIENLLKIHRLEIDLAEKTLPIAQQHGSNLLSQIVATLQDGHKFPGAPNVAEPVRLALLIGHETNVAHIERLLNLGWHIPGFQANEASPGSALAFELFREVSTGRRYVRLGYFAQTPDQMRQATVLNLAQRPGAVAVDLPACAAFAYEQSCPLERFVEIAKAALDPGCVTIKP